MRASIAALAAAATFVGAQSTTSIDVDAISVAVPTSVFVLPVVYVTEEGAPTVTALTLATTATASSDAAATNVFDSAADVSEAISSASVAAATSTIDVAKRDATCVAQPSGISYNTVVDTPAAFAADAWYSAQAAAAGTPSGVVQTFAGLTASNSADNYMGFTLLSSYDVPTCVSKCSAIAGCNSVNIYFERDPLVNPDSAACSNPASTVNVKCVFWGGAVTSANANNFGQWRENFQVLIAGSNGYVNSAYAASLAAKATSTSSSAASYATDSAGTIYTLYYSSDSTQGAYANAAASSSYKDCMTACDADSSCNAFTYVGGTNGVGSGTCWLKSTLGSPSSSGTNVLSGSKSGVASNNKLVSTSASTTSSSSSSSSTVSSTSSTSSSSKTSSSSTVSSTSSSTSSTVSSTTTSTSTSATPTTMSTVTKSSSTSSSSTTSSSTSTTQTTSTTTSAGATTTPFYIQIEGSGTSADNKYVSVATGQSGTASFVSTTQAATKFVIDNNTGALLEYTGSTNYAANLATSSSLQKLIFSAQGSTAYGYAKCSLNTGAGWVECSVQSKGQAAVVCPSDSYQSLNFYTMGSASINCPWVGLYYIPASA